MRFLPHNLYNVSLSLEEELRLVDISIALKEQVLSMIFKAQSGHPGGSLSCTDILVCLYEKILHHSPLRPDDPQRDIFVLSKGHAVPALYAILARYGYFSPALLDGLREFGSPLQGHPKHIVLPGIEASTGSLGMGPSIGIGLALAARMDSCSRRIYVLLGDGECDEGSVWEAAMGAAHFHLENLVFLVDRNGIQLDGPTEKIMSLEPFAAKWEAFGWHVIEVDGTSIRELLMAFETAHALRGKPVVIIAYMIKGQGVSFMSHVKEFHGKPPTSVEYRTAIEELHKYRDQIVEQLRQGTDRAADSCCDCPPSYHSKS